MRLVQGSTISLSPEGVVKAPPQRRSPSRTRIACPSFQVDVESPDRRARPLNDAMLLRRGRHEPLGGAPAQRMDARPELAGAVGHEHRPGQQAMAAADTPDRVLGGRVQPRCDRLTVVLPRQIKRDILAVCPLFSILGPEELTVLADLAREQRVAQDAVVLHRGATDSSLLILVHGRLRASATSTEGRDVTISLMEPGAVLGEIALLDGGPRSLDVVAMAESLLLVVERRQFLPFLRARPELMLKLMELLCDRLRRTSTAYEDLALAPLSTRLARLLLGMAEAHGKPTPEGIQIRLALSQRNIAAQVAATRERVNKQLRQWHEAGVLGSQDGYLVLRKPAALRALLG